MAILYSNYDIIQSGYNMLKERLIEHKGEIVTLFLNGGLLVVNAKLGKVTESLEEIVYITVRGRNGFFKVCDIAGFIEQEKGAEEDDEADGDGGNLSQG